MATLPTAKGQGTTNTAEKLSSSSSDHIQSRPTSSTLKGQLLSRGRRSSSSRGQQQRGPPSPPRVRARALVRSSHRCPASEAPTDGTPSASFLSQPFRLATYFSKSS